MTAARNPHQAELDRFGPDRIGVLENVLGRQSKLPIKVRVRDLLGLASRETNLLNIVGGGTFDKDGKWVPSGHDRGYWQISIDSHQDWLAAHVGCRSGTDTPDWSHTAADVGYCPTLWDGAAWTIQHLHDSAAYGAENGVPAKELLRFALAAHNAGPGGALKGWKAGDVDRFSTGGDYSADAVERSLWSYRWLVANGL